MIVDKFNPQQFFQRIENLALFVPAGEIFGLLRRTLALPAAWAALVQRATGGGESVPAGGSIDGEDAATVLFVRVTPWDIRQTHEHLRSADGFSCDADVTLRLRVIPESAELRSFIQSIVGSRRVVQLKALSDYVEAAIHAGLAQLAVNEEAAGLVEGRCGDAAVDAVRAALEGLCFRAGLALADPPVVRFRSTSLRAVHQAEEDSARRLAAQAAARQVDEALARARHERLEELSGLLSRLQALASSSPQVGLAELIRTFDQHQRGQIYEALFAGDAAPTRTQWLAVAAGDEVIYFDPARPESPARRVRIVGGAGAVRSVQGFQADAGAPWVLWLGAGSGVYRLPVRASTPDLTLTVPDATGIRGGFNAVAVLGQRVLASHSELGLIEWRLDQPDQPVRRFVSETQSAQAVRNMQCVGENFFASVDDRILQWHVDAPDDEGPTVIRGGRAAITALVATADGVFAGNSEGEVLHWPAGRQDLPDILYRGGQRPVESVAVLETHGVRRILFTDTSLYVHAQVPGDAFACRYEAGGQTLRRVEVAADLLVATNDIRDRLIAWRPDRPDKPAFVIPVSSLCGRSVQDVFLIPQA